MNLNKNNGVYLKNALVLAYLGDAVFNVLTREYLVKTFDYKPNKLNKMANLIVCAKNQAEIMRCLKNELNDEDSISEEQLFDVKTNICLGTKYLKYLENKSCIL